MARNTKFMIDTDTGHFIVTSDEFVYEQDILKVPVSEVFQVKVKGVHQFKTVWNWENELLEMTMDGVDALPILSDEKNPIHSLVKTAKEHHFSVQRYERT